MKNHKRGIYSAAYGFGSAVFLVCTIIAFATGKFWPGVCGLCITSWFIFSIYVVASEEDEFGDPEDYHDCIWKERKKILQLQGEIRDLRSRPEAIGDGATEPVDHV